VKGQHVQDDSVTPAEDVVAAYEWETGACYRCGRVGCPTAAVGTLQQESGTVQVRACERCTLLLERERERAAQRYGWPYSPGTPANPGGPDAVGDL
jgi:hypothetical protein